MAAELKQRHAFNDIPRSFAVAIRDHSIRLTNSTAQDLGADALLYSGPEDAVAMIYQVDDLPTDDLWLDGKHQRARTKT